jgi:hypothetical protein
MRVTLDAPRPQAQPVPRLISRILLTVRLDAASRKILAYPSPVPGWLLLYGPKDFSAAAADSMDDHAARVAEILGNDPAAVLQALCDGRDLPAPPQRVPRELPGWRIKAELALRGLIPEVQAAIAALQEPDATVARLAWESASFSRKGALVAAVAAKLGWADAYLDDIFLTAAKIPT